MVTAAVGVAAVALVAVLATRSPAAQTSAETPLIGKPAPHLAGASLTGGGEVRLSSLRGRLVLVNFFASWCIPCQQEEPALDAFARAHGQAGDAVVLGVVDQDQPSAAARFVERSGGRYPVVADPDGQLGLAYGVRGPPTSFLVARDGRIVTKIVGPVTAAGLDHLVALARARGY